MTKREKAAKEAEKLRLEVVKVKLEIFRLIMLIPLTSALFALALFKLFEF